MSSSIVSLKHGTYLEGGSDIQMSHTEGLMQEAQSPHSWWCRCRTDSLGMHYRFPAHAIYSLLHGGKHDVPNSYDLT